MPDLANKEMLPTIKAMIVEDHKLTRIGLRALLERTEDIKVVAEAENGREAVEKAGQHKPDVILMDVGMPEMDGIQAVQEIRDKYKGINTIMLTSHDNDRDIFASLASGACGYCLKDVDPERLFTAIRSVNAGDIWLDSAIASRVMKFYSTNSGNSQSSDREVEKKQDHHRADDMPPLPAPLSARELEVLSCVVEGLSNQQIADKLIISLATAKTHVRNILNKLAVDDRTQAAVHAMRRGLV